MIASFNPSNDHFDRISRARQIAQYGELPFRDFFDPGYFLAEFTSAAAQRALGDHLLGEMVLTSVFIASGGTLVLALACRATGSAGIALAAALLSMLAMPRAYDFDKVLFYPLGILLCWRLVAQPNGSSARLLGAGLVAAALFRYDTGVYLGCAAAVTMLAVHRRDWRTLANRTAQLSAAALVTALPFLVYLQFNGGLANAADQIGTYAVREGARTRIGTPLTFSVGELVRIQPPPPRTIRIRFVPSVDEAERRALAAHFGLGGETPHGDPGDRSWDYQVGDPQAEFRRLIADPRVEDTHGLDRSSGTLPRESLWTRVLRRMPLLRTRVLPDFWDAGNAAAFLYHLLIGLPAIAIALQLFRFRASAPVPAAEHARMAGLVALCVMLDLFILRDPVAARAGGMAGPAAILGAWLAARAWRSRALPARFAVAALLALTVWSTWVSADWGRRVFPQVTGAGHLVHNLEVMSASPLPLSQLQSGRMIGPVRYVRECTRPDDRVFAAGFVPELFFFAQRGFAAGLLVSFGGHWSEPRYAERMLDRLASQRVPVAIFKPEDYERLRRDYPLLDRYFRAHYRNAGSIRTPEGGDSSYEVWVDTRRPPTGTDAVSSLPCFGEPSRQP